VLRYCNKLYLSQHQNTSSPSKSQGPPATAADDEDAAPSIYHTLLALYLTPPPPFKENFEPALNLLSNHGSRLPASSTLDLIPADVLVTKLESYFLGRIRAANSVVNESRISVGLRKTGVVSSQSMLLLGEDTVGVAGGRNRRVAISEERICGVCHKRLGGSALRVYPNNEVVHYGCSPRVDGKAVGSIRPVSRR
jgi:Vam6/Vps39-like protein vacuolar protein sorting-associated protein 39